MLDTAEYENLEEAATVAFFGLWLKRRQQD